MRHQKKNNHFTVLGLPPDAKAEEIRSAYRKLAKKYHPDSSAGETDKTDSSAKFREIQEAYENLQGRCPNHDESDTGGWNCHHPISVRQHRHEFFHDPLRLWFTLFPSSVFEAESGRDVDFEIILSRQEAREGALLELELPISQPCARCRAIGFLGFTVCPFCHGNGNRVRMEHSRLRLPSGLRDGQILELLPHGSRIPLVASIKIS